MTIQVDSFSSRFSDNTSSNFVPSRFDTVRRVAGSTSLDTRSRSSVPTLTVSSPTNCPATPSTSPETAPTAKELSFVPLDGFRDLPGDEQERTSRSLSGGSDEKFVSIWSAGPVIRRLIRYELTCVSRRGSGAAAVPPPEKTRAGSPSVVRAPAHATALRPGSHLAVERGVANGARDAHVRYEFDIQDALIDDDGPTEVRRTSRAVAAIQLATGHRRRAAGATAEIADASA